MPEQSKADRQGNPVAQAMQAVARNGHQQKRGKHQIEERMEVKISRPQQAELNQKIEVPAGKAAPVLPEGRRHGGILRKFNVTAKGGLVEEEYVDWVISRPYIFLVLLNLVGVAVGIWRYFYGPPTEMLTVVVSMVWVFYNLIILGGAVAVSVESKQVRRSHRVEMTMPAAIAREDGHLFSCTVQDFSDGGLGIKINGQAQILEGQKVNLLLKRGQQEYVFPAQVARVMGNEVGLKLMPLTTQQHIDFVQCTFARADTWALWQDSYPEDKPLESLLDILKLGFRGYRHLAEFAPSSVKGIFRVLTSLVSWVVSFIPRRPERSETAQPSDQALAQQ